LREEPADTTRGSTANSLTGTAGRWAEKIGGASAFQKPAICEAATRQTSEHMGARIVGGHFHGPFLMYHHMTKMQATNAK